MITNLNKMTNHKIILDAPGYETLAEVLSRAFNQATAGKGKERHANDLPFDKQPMQTIAAAHGVGFLTGQAAKKTQEAHGLPHDRAVAEILGAINYLAGAIIFMETSRKPVDVVHVKIPEAFMNVLADHSAGIVTRG